jgi:hypothetical protein
MLRAAGLRCMYVHTAGTLHTRKCESCLQVVLLCLKVLPCFCMGTYPVLC